MKRNWLLIILLALTCVTVEAQTVYFECPNVTTNLPEGGTEEFATSDIVRNQDGTYTVLTSLPDPNSTKLSAIHRLSTGNGWLLSLPVSSCLGCVDPPGAVFCNECRDSRDVFFWNGVLTDPPQSGDFSGLGTGQQPYAPYAGARGLIPEGTSVDAAFVDSTEAVVVSFASTTTIVSTGITYEKSDLVRYNGASFDNVPYFDASAAGIPSNANLISADRIGLLTVFTFDAATDITIDQEAMMILAGQLISWDGHALAVFDLQPGWPSTSSQVVALTFAAAATQPGHIESLMVEREEVDLLRFNWTASNCAGAQNAAVYQGNLVSLRDPIPAEKYDHVPIVCEDTFPFLEEVVLVPQVDVYFLVVARNAVPFGTGEEGSYGLGDGTNQRPVRESCALAQILSCQ